MDSKQLERRTRRLSRAVAVLLMQFGGSPLQHVAAREVDAARLRLEVAAAILSADNKG